MPRERSLIAEAAAAHHAVTKPSNEDNLRVQPKVCNGAYFDGTIPARFCDALRGGSRYYTANTFTTLCSLGFWAGAPGAAWNNTFFLTAGHCQQNPMGRSWTSCTSAHQCSVAGWQAAVHYDDFGGDNGALYISNNPWGREAGWTDWRTGARLVVQYYDSAPVGTPVCHGGSTTGIACGFVVATNATVPVLATNIHGPRTLAGMIDARGPCTQGGDSGGPVVNQNLQGAVGIVSAGECGSGDSGGNFGGPNNRLVIEPVQRIINTYGIYPYGG